MCPPPAGHPDPIAYVSLPNGNRVEFFDFGDRALITEAGRADVAPVLNGIHRQSLANVWQELTDDPVPRTVAALDARLESKSAATQAMSVSSRRGWPPRDAPSSPSDPDSSTQSGGAAGVTPGECGNGCCNTTWLQNNLCINIGGDYTWYLFDYGWSYVNSSSISEYDGVVCAATGTSEYTVDISGGYGGVWDVPEAHWRSYHWSEGCCDESLTTQVNSATNTHLHTYCGGLYH
jgi:hypothetical protein